MIKSKQINMPEQTNTHQDEFEEFCSGFLDSPDIFHKRLAEAKSGDEYSKELDHLLKEKSKHYRARN